MRRQSHFQLGVYLADRYFEKAAKIYRYAFLLGCVEPDHNPFTYIKGSIKYAWMRGHNFRNARRFIRKLSLRLENQEQWSIWDYYALGKLIHYTADAFTQAHNESFPLDLHIHRCYEVQLQQQFLSYLKSEPEVEIFPATNIMETILSYHAEYISARKGISNDVRYALAACSCIVSLLFTCRIVLPLEYCYASNCHKLPGSSHFRHFTDSQLCYP